ncbi:MAG TPA: metal ABC transporter substrate-binding protein [Thermomicrobiales bacterium]|nr:metal ABC transporter substrate-binding protein [Thermomicrobiales bacterium]
MIAAQPCTRPLRFVIPVLLVLSFMLPETRSAASAQDDGPVVAVSTPILADIVSNVAGDNVEVYSVIPAGADPHTWEPSPQDMVRVAESDTFIFMGASLEPFIESGGWRRAVREAEIPQLTLADQMELIEVDKVIDHGDHTHDLREGDPHVWLDPRKVMEMLPIVSTHLATIDPGRANAYSENAAAYRGELEALDAELEHDLATIPEDRRKLIVFHDAYTYFAARYDFEVIGIVLKNPNTEVSARELADLEATIRESGMDVIFAEPQFNTDVLDVLVDEGDVVVAELMTDTFAGKVSTYIELMRFNRDSMVEHLGEASSGA